MKTMSLFLAAVIVMVVSMSAPAQDSVFRIGMIGLDTSHVIGFTRYLNDPNNHTGCRVVAGFPGGSPDIESSINRIENFTNELREKYHVEIVDSIETLCTRVDGILLESVDGRPHLEQLKPALKAKLPVFIDKPVAGSLVDVLEIYRLAREAAVPCWSSSALRFSPDLQKAKTQYGKVLGCSVYSPCALEKHHPDLYWYGVHGVEMLYTLMGPGCQTVQRTQTADTELVVGVWQDGRVGTFRGLRSGKYDYGGTVFGSKSNGPTGGFSGYDALVAQIVTFFKTGVPPVSAEETIELFAFMSAADESKTRNGAPVSIQSVLETAKKKRQSQ